MNEFDFDLLLETNLPDVPPPEDILQNVTPWRKAWNRILIGMAITTITLNFGLINYVMTAFGLILMFLGFRTLSVDNQLFRRCYHISALRLGLNTILLIINATIYQAKFYDTAFADILSGLNLALIFALFFSFWRGLLTVQEKAGMKKSAKGAVALLVWYALLCIWAVLLPIGGWFIAIPMLIGYIAILRSLWKLSKVLDETGYVITTAPIRISDRNAVLIIAAILTLGISCGYLFFDQYPMDWAIASPSSDPVVAQVKEELLAKGFPEDALEDLSDDDILDCEGAIRVMSKSEVYPINPGRKVYHKEDDPRQPRTTSRTVYDVKELRLTSIGVELAGEREQWKLIHHFQWDVDPGYFGTESIQLWPTDRLDEGWRTISDFSGHVRYDFSGQIFASPYYFMGYETFTSSSFFFGEQSSTDFFADFSFPREGERQRGYLAYTIEEINDGWILDSWINYTHQMKWAQYPVKTAKESRRTDSFNLSGTFELVQDALQFYPFYPDDLPN